MREKGTCIVALALASVLLAVCLSFPDDDLCTLAREAPPPKPVVVDTPLPVSDAFGRQGLAVYANKGWRDIVLYNQIHRNGYPNLRCDYCTGYAALADCSKIGQDIWLQFGDDFLIEGPLRVYDCASKRDRPIFERLGRIVEIDGYVAEAHKVRAPVPVTLYEQSPCGRKDRQGQILICKN